MVSIPLTDARTKCSATTRQAMLDAARRHFVQESYENVGLRDIAGEVGVDVALVSRYFGSKEDLFREVLGLGEKEDVIPTGLSPKELAAYMADMFVSRGGDDGRDHVEHMLIILRSASSPTASRLVRDALCSDILCPMSKALPGQQPEMRAGLSMGVWMGMTILQTIMSVEPLCEMGDELKPRLRKLFEAALAAEDDAAPVNGNPLNVEECAHCGGGDCRCSA